MSIKDWLEYALRLSSLFSEMKVSEYHDAILYWMAREESAAVALVRSKETKGMGHERDGGGTVPAREDGHSSCSSSASLTCGGTAMSAATTTIANGMDDSLPVVLPCPTTSTSLPSSLHQKFFLSKPPSGGVIAKTREACLDEEEFIKEQVYFRLSHPIILGHSGQKDTSGTDRDLNSRLRFFAEATPPQELHSNAPCLPPWGASTDGYVLTKDDEAVLEREARRQEHPDWWEGGVEVADKEEKGEKKEKWRNPHPPTPPACGVPHLSPKRKEEEEWPDPSPRPSSVVSAETCQVDAPPSHSNGLYGELTSRGVRQMHTLHWHVLQQAEARRRPHGSSPSFPSSSSPLACLLALDIGSGTGKVVLEWHLRLQKACRGHIAASEWSWALPPPSSQASSQEREGGGETAFESPSCHATTTGVEEGQEVWSAVMGIELVPSRMAVAKRAMHGHYREIQESPVDRLLPTRAEREVGVGSLMPVARHPSFGPLHLLTEPSLPTPTPSNGRTQETPGVSPTPSPSLSTPSPLLDSGRQENHDPHVDLPRRNLGQKESLWSSFPSPSGPFSSPVVLAEVNALHPHLLHNTLLLPPPFLSRPPNAATPLAFPFTHSKAETGSTSGEGRHAAAQEREWGKAEAVPLHPHLAVFCCGVGFDERFVRRLCGRLEGMLPLPPIPAHPPCTPSPPPPPSIARPSYWHTASFLFLFKPFDVATVLQSGDFPLFRWVREWRLDAKAEGRLPPVVPPLVGLSQRRTSFDTSSTETMERQGEKTITGPLSARSTTTSPLSAVAVLPPHAVRHRIEAETEKREEGKEDTDGPTRGSIKEAGKWRCDPQTATSTPATEARKETERTAAEGVVPPSPTSGAEAIDPSLWGNAPRRMLHSSVATFTHVETTWMKETPAWHVVFTFEEEKE